MTQQPPATRVEALDLLAAARADLIAAIEGMPVEQMCEPGVAEGWSTKDLLAHVAAWDEQMLPDYERIRSGRMPALAFFNPGQINEWNALQMEMRSKFSLEQVRFELDDYRLQMIGILEKFDEGTFASGFVPATVAIAAGHDREHAQHIRAWRNQKGV